MRKRNRRGVLVLLVTSGCLLLMPAGVQAESGAFDPGHAGFTVKVRGETCPYRVFGVYVLPGESLPISVIDGEEGSAFEIVAEKGTIRRDGPARWSWDAPERTGLYVVEVRRRGSGERIRLNIFVMVPHERLEGETLNGYRIGSYPRTPLRGLEIYKPPKGFIEVTRENAKTPISPHFTLDQFLCKQESGYPKYMVMREGLLLKLEYLLETINDKGFRCDSFHVMSGFRTPYYNTLIGNVKYSRHLWGGAADIFIDVSPRDGVMDDLNGDGRIDGKDSNLLYDLIEGLGPLQSYKKFIGGLGRYVNSHNHGPFVHVDVRGFRARWGR
jgi:hypothetical protein